jgi:hypothetical protein
MMPSADVDAASSALRPASGVPAACEALPAKSILSLRVARPPVKLPTTPPIAMSPAMCTASMWSMSSAAPASIIVCAPLTPSSAGWNKTRSEPAKSRFVSRWSRPTPMVACAS